jgi:hypothetical protein
MLLVVLCNIIYRDVGILCYFLNLMHHNSRGYEDFLELLSKRILNAELTVR